MNVVSALALLAYVSGTSLVIFGCCPLCTLPQVAVTVGILVLIRAMSISFEIHTVETKR